mmetsp:Transcript_55302/g.147625  ORF Transcript_55302/g.147625 Transcript_55302/m.147625 type:complete len:220 (-) Transcript_55302:1288-1947(-)
MAVWRMPSSKSVEILCTWCVARLAHCSSNPHETDVSTPRLPVWWAHETPILRESSRLHASNSETCSSTAQKMGALQRRYRWSSCKAMLRPYRLETHWRRNASRCGTFCAAARKTGVLQQRSRRPSYNTISRPSVRQETHWRRPASRCGTCCAAARKMGGFQRHCRRLRCKTMLRRSGQKTRWRRHVISCGTCSAAARKTDAWQQRLGGSWTSVRPHGTL